VSETVAELQEGQHVPSGPPVYAGLRVDSRQGLSGHGRADEHAVKLLSEIAAVVLEAPGRTLKRGEVFGTVEAPKAVSELLAPKAPTV
jgi:Glycine cleavage H-protein